MKNEQMIPMMSVVAKPRIGPVPKTYSMTPVMSDVEVGVEDGGEGVAVTFGDSLLDALPGAQLLTYTLVDEHVGIHRRT